MRQRRAREITLRGLPPRGAQTHRPWATLGYAGVGVRYAAPMGFGKNPHVAKAQAAEQKAQVATDEAARTLAWREAARLWDRAAEREQRDVLAASYLERAVAARAAADADPNAPDAPDTEDAAHTADAAQEAPSESAPGRAPPRWLN